MDEDARRWRRVGRAPHVTLCCVTYTFAPVTQASWVRQAYLLLPKQTQFISLTHAKNTMVLPERVREVTLWLLAVFGYSTAGDQRSHCRITQDLDLLLSPPVALLTSLAEGHRVNEP